ncbi:hypothetical protein [Hymenobacter volaticus]|uniref:SHSP domain-containing protein n=1 Tax=Hymenobacter volaticus TaxID=2932254 RepID=A0ABY4GAC6_9BACT|nr:hypothetical protein [Hymenobacter volaticus]UOQ67838.1 hypothetical protein MUN86_08265 [Hymenobacter volaticus]
MRPPPVGDFRPLPVVTVAPAPKLLFLSGRLTTEASGSRLHDMHAEAVPGTLKTPETATDTSTFLRVSQLDSRHQVVSETRVTHPLRRSLEHVADDQRTFQRTEVKLSTAEFFVRLALKPTAATVRIEEIANGQTFILSELPIPSKI